MSQHPHREQTLDLGELTRDERLRFRDRLHHASGKAQEYAESMREYGGWGEFPAAVVVELVEPFEWQADAEPERFARTAGPKSLRHVYPAGTLILVGGFTRCEAMAAAAEGASGDASFDSRVKCHILSGTWEDALLLALKENAKHGQGRSAAEKDMVLYAVHANPKWRLLPEREVAEMTGIHRSTVNRWRQKTAEAWGTKAKPAPAPEPEADIPPLAAYQGDPEDETPEGSPAPTASAPILRDEWGRPVPPHCAALFECVPALKKAARDIRSACLTLGELKHGTPPDPTACVSPGMSLVDLKTISASGLTAADLIDAQGPFIVCPECDGHGDARGKCRVCKGRGVLTRAQAMVLTGPLEGKAKSFRGAK